MTREGRALDDQDATLGDSLGGVDASGDGLATAPDAAGDPDHDAVFARLDRFVVLQEIGAGAMGRVYVAYDPKLDRRLALKLIRAPGDPEVAAARSARLIREARAIARLSHPNVVAVYDVGTVGAEVFIAMEYVDGRSLRAWLGEPRSVDAIVEVMRQAGSGLAAAHRAEIVHRDFKPDNVLVGADGRVRVVDFGLARLAPEADALATAEPDTLDAAPLETRTGALMGTPAYMAPELFDGRVASPLTDQYAFGVTLYEALYGRRPRSATSLAGLIDPGPIELPAQGKCGAIPAWLRAVVERCLAEQPSARFRGLDAVLEAMKPARPRHSRLVIASLLGAAGIAAALVFLLPRSDRQAPTCEGGEAAFAELWSAERREALDDGFSDTQLGFASDSLARVIAGLDAYGRAWATEQRDACAATLIHALRSRATLDARMACLERRLWEVEAVLDVLAEPDDAAIEAAVRAVAELTPPSICRTADASSGPASPNPEQTRRLERELALASAEGTTGELERASERIQQVLADADELGDPSLAAEAGVVLGELQLALGNHDEAATGLEQSYWTASRIDAGPTIARAAIARAASAEASGEFARGLDWLGHADLALARLPGPTSLDARTLMVRGDLELGLGRFEAALANQREAERRLAPLANRRLELADAIDGSARALQRLGRLDEALDADRRALAILVDTLGPLHPEVGRKRGMIGAILAQSGDYESARVELEAAIELFAGALGPNHPRLRSPITNLGNVYALLGNNAQAVTLYRRALAIAEASDGPDAVGLATPLNNLGLALVELGQLDEAERVARRALELRREQLGERHPAVSMSLHNLGDLAQRRGEPARALELFEQSLAMRIESLGDRHIRTAETQLFMAELLLAEFPARRSEAIALLTAAEATLAASTDDPLRLARARLSLAQAIWPGQRERALELGRTVADRDDELGDRARAWLASVGPV